MKKEINSIQVLGSGCPSCRKLYELGKQAVEDLGIAVEVEYISDIEKILALGLMSSPVMLINDNPVILGRVPSLIRIKEIIAEQLKD